jgi:hypothetical protein
MWARMTSRPSLRHLPAVLIAMVVIARTLAGVAAIIRPYLRVDYDLWFELGMVTGQVVVQWCVLWRRTWAERFDYAGVLVLVSGIGAALLWPLLAWNHHAAVTPWIGVLYFFAVVGIIFAIHIAFVMRMKLPKLLCLTWALYRFAILLYVTKL